MRPVANAKDFVAVFNNHIGAVPLQIRYDKLFGLQGFDRIEIALTDIHWQIKSTIAVIAVVEQTKYEPIGVCLVPMAALSNKSTCPEVLQGKFVLLKSKIKRFRFHLSRNL